MAEKDVAGRTRKEATPFLLHPSKLFIATKKKFI
jgi:hypothetical protein